MQFLYPRIYVIEYYNTNDVDGDLDVNYSVREMQLLYIDNNDNECRSVLVPNKCIIGNIASGLLWNQHHIYNRIHFLLRMISHYAISAGANLLLTSMNNDK